MKLVKLVIALALLNLLALGQIINNKGTKEQDTFIQTVSGTPILMFDGIGTQTNQFEVIPTGAPATVSVVVIGCMRSGTCSGTLASTTSTANSILAVSGGPYDYYQITASWTGGSSPTIKINRTGTAARSNSGGVAASVPFSGITSGINTSALMQVSNGANLQPLNFGNIINTETWMFPTDPFPSAAGPTWGGANTGGSLVSANNYGVTVTLNSAAGETTPSGIAAFQLSTHVPACITSNCVITVTAPTLPIGFTGYTVYAQNISGSQPLQKIAGCVNISTNCTFGSIPTTTAPPATNALVPVPPNALASRCPPNVSPVWWLPDSNGNMNAQAYLSFFTDNTFGPPSPSGIFIECGHHFFTDQKVDPPGGKNAMVVIDHTAGVGTSTTNQDRALWIQNQTVANDITPHYALEGIQGTVDYNCTICSITGSPDGEISGISMNTQTNAASTFTSNGGTSGLRLSMFKQGAFMDGNNAFGVNTSFTNSNTSNVNNEIGYAVSFSGNGSGIAVGLKYNFPNPRLGVHYGLWVSPSSATAANGDWLIRNDVHNLNSNMNGPVGLLGISSSDMAALPVSASMALTGSFSANQIPSGWVNGYSPGCSGGASSYTYQFVAVDANGGQSVSAATAGIATCTNPLTSGNPLTMSAGGSTPITTTFASVVRIDVYRVSGPMALGKIGSLTCANNMPIFGCSSFTDTGLAASGTLPAVNTTGSATAYVLGTATNCAAVGSAANPSVAACAAASAGSFSCATAASTGTCTVNTTAVTANSQIFIQQRSDTTTGTRLGVTCNTGVTTVIPDITTVVAATSFTINLGTVAVNPECFSYFVVNQ